MIFLLTNSLLLFLDAKECTVKTTKDEWCHFPFTYKGVKYEKCTTKDYSVPWCATNDEDGWGVCEGENVNFYIKLGLNVMHVKVSFIFVHVQECVARRRS